MTLHYAFLGRNKYIIILPIFLLLGSLSAHFHLFIWHSCSCFLLLHSIWYWHRSYHWNRTIGSACHLRPPYFSSRPLPQLFATSLAHWATSFFSVSLVQNILTTLFISEECVYDFKNLLTSFFIVYRIWRVNMNVSKLGGSRSLWPVMAVLLESGAIYSGTLFVLLMTYASGSFSQYIALDMLVPIIVGIPRSSLTPPTSTHVI